MRRLAASTLALLALAAASPAGAARDGVGFELREARVTPGHPLFDGERRIKLHYGFAARRGVDLRISVVHARSGRVVRAYKERNASPGRRLKRVWNGLNRRGKAAPDGLYEFYVGPTGGGEWYAARFHLEGHVFPVDGPHGTRGPIGEFHAPRNGGRIHEGFDVTGACGTPLLAARGGVVKKAGYDPQLYGNYVLIDATKSEQDLFYAHMTSPSRAGDGERVRTGEVVSDIGRTGNAASTPCHLHIEIRVHGQPIDPEPYLRHWDG